MTTNPDRYTAATEEAVTADDTPETESHGVSQAADRAGDARETAPHGAGADPVDAEPSEHALPVVVAAEALLMPHMTIPFPLDLDENALAVDRAMRMTPRRVLLVAARDLDDIAEEGEEASGPARDLIDMVSDMIAQEYSQDGDVEDDEEEYEEDAFESGGLGGRPLIEDLHRVGVIAEIAQYITRPGGQDHVILQGVSRGAIESVIQEEPYLAARVRRAEDRVGDSAESEAAMAAVIEQVESYVNLLPNVPEEVLDMIRSIEDPGWMADLIAFSPEFTSAQRQELLEQFDPVGRLRRVSVFIQKRLNLLNLRHQIQNEAQEGMEKQQREYYLREQLRAIQKELGEGSGEEAVANEFREKIESIGMPDEVREKALVQLDRLEQQHPFSPEIGIIRSYLEWLTELPWSVETEDLLDLDEAARILDEDHHGLEKVKDRILEFIAVRKLAGDKQRAPILLFVGPPGVGKTSLGKSIARAIGRKYVRMSLGGVRDEAEIRGHRRTYVGAMPGRMVKALRDAGSKNPVMVLDEVDKLGSDTFRGDPSSALLEVLDPEQNTTFSDHYLEVPFDLSKVIFITTANMLDPIPPALRDRMEIIEVSGYTEIEKMAIARNYLLPKALESHGLSEEQLTITDEAVRRLIREYTEESGVRNLEREIGALARKVARKFAAADAPEHFRVDGDEVQELLGVPRYEFGLAEEHDEVGVATGAAVTSVGGDLLAIEVTIAEGKGELTLTGQLGDVMKESARAALSYARSRADQLGIDAEVFDKRNIHIHIPAGAIPKDGPSAGITMATAVISALTGQRVRKDVAMTGEITLRGKVLPIGGLREKTLAAHRGGITTFLLPRKNAKDLSELPEIVRNEVELIEVGHLDEVLDIAFVKEPGRKRAGKGRQGPKPGDKPGKSPARGSQKPVKAPGKQDPIPANMRDR
jgi:ATP-dependent Lon protease